jgi:hypothetical protein
MSVNEPSLYTCEACGVHNFSPTSGPHPFRKNEVTKKLEKQYCTCGGSFKYTRPLFVFKAPPKPDMLAKIVIFHKKCGVKFRRFSPGCFRCANCQELGFVRGANSEIWFKISPSELVISYHGKA